ncbi:MAG: bifunctional DNA-formamidopyrimidine glycosylase/DNA-(apurinic or apyrimidinic site) lyase [Actinomycetales bacterium]|nr:bifunctional DNA-formamidopyrimidine glycosylase/DNA-(apurinic or apyrimidinic site) lyase [Actinomycetales bacterium]
MPELPEVETVRRGLAAILPGRRVASVAVEHPRVTRRGAGPGTGQALRTGVRGRTITAVHRRGKFLWLDLAGRPLVVHLGMSGQVLLTGSAAPEVLVHSRAHRRLRLRLAPDDAGELWFVDQRTFGWALLDDYADVHAVSPVPRIAAHIAADPLDTAFDINGVLARIRGRRAGIKSVLLDQTVVSGIGNIYADEALWRARLHYATPAHRLPAARVRTLLGHVTDIFQAALGKGGTSFDALYRDVNGRSGRFAVDLDAYGRGGQPCRRCGRSLVREPFANRSSVRCPRCQRRPRGMADPVVGA